MGRKKAGSERRRPVWSFEGKKEPSKKQTGEKKKLTEKRKKEA